MSDHAQDRRSPKFGLPRDIAVRAYVRRKDRPVKSKRRQHPEVQPIEPSNYVLILDTETTIDPAQALRFGIYQLRNGTELEEAGIFFDRATLSGEDQVVLRQYAADHNLKFLTLSEFIDDIFYGIAYDLGAIIVGFNLPFDLSRLAFSHGPAKSQSIRGGFTFKLSNDPRRPNVQIKHLTRTASIIRFAKPAHRELRHRGLTVPPSRGYFVDVRTLAAALTNKSFSLASLAKFLGTPHQKLDTDEHGGPLTPDYITYAAQDVQVTWECFEELRIRFERLKLTKTPIHHVYSVAGIGKASLKEMGIRPWQEIQPEFPPEILGNIMSTYYGGRSEVHLRRVITPVIYCDFLSMYPTVCTLMRLWDFVVGKEMKRRESTVEVREFLERVTAEDLQNPATWLRLCTIVQISPDDDILPVRAKYPGESHLTTGVNRLKNKRGWYTLADCIASKLLTGKAPKVLRAITFTPGEVQDGLMPIAVAGNPDYPIDPARDDLFRRGIDMRNEVKAMLKTSGETKGGALDILQGFLKILINSTSYGIFLELIVEDLLRLEAMRCYGPEGKGFPVELDKFEEPGRYFHPLLGTLITGAARLMLAITESLITNAGLDWAFCDTDSMAIAKPEAMTWPVFIERVREIQGWFTPLNPYAVKEPLLKVEDVNYAIVDGKLTDAIEPLFCLAVSAKRYALFNQKRDGTIVIRQASAHGLGHLWPPYGEQNPPSDIPRPVVSLHEIGIERWQHDLWYKIIAAALKGPTEPPGYSRLPGFEQPAIVRYAATTPSLLRGFRLFNRGKPYRQQVRPFNFMFMLMRDKMADPPSEIPAGTNAAKIRSRKLKPGQPRVLAPFNKDIAKVLEQAFDRDTGKTIPAARLKSYIRSIGSYHKHPEAKFENGDWEDFGSTVRRLIEATAFHHIGKEAHRWDEQFFLGHDPEARLEYGMTRTDNRKLFSDLRRAVKIHGETVVAQASEISRQQLSAILKRDSLPTNETLAKLGQATAVLKVIDAEAKAVFVQVRKCCRLVPKRRFAELAGMDAGQLSRVTKGQCLLSGTVLAKFKKALALYEAQYVM